MDQVPPRGKAGRYQAGRSGNPKGRPRKDAAEPTTALVPSTQDRLDGWRNAQSGHGTTRDRRTQTRYSADIVTDIEAQQLRRSEFLAAAIIEQVPKEALKRPWSLKCEDKEVGNAICKQAEALGLDQALYDAWTKENEAGGAAIFPVISGAQGELYDPLDERSIASVDAFHVFEPQELTPAAYYTDIRNPKFRKPSAYRLQPINSGRAGYLPFTIIHETRLVIFPGLRTSEQIQPGQREGWGDSKLCRPWQVMADFGLAWGSAATLLHGHGKETLEMDGLGQMLSQADGLDEFDRHTAAMQMAWSTLRMNVIDGKSKISRATGTLAGVSDILSKFESLMAAAAERPVSILMGVGSTGLRTGDDDVLSWHSTIERDTSHHLKPRHEHIIKLMFLSTSGPTSGKEPESWSVEYPPLRSPNEKEIAETRKLDMERAKIAIDSGIASADDVAESFYKGDTYSGDIVIDWDRRAAQAKVDAEQAAQIEQDTAAMDALGRSPELGGAPPVTQDRTDDSDEYDEDMDDDDPDEDTESDDDEEASPGVMRAIVRRIGLIPRLEDVAWVMDGEERYDFSPGQARDAHGRFGHGGAPARATGDSKTGKRLNSAADRLVKAKASFEAAKQRVAVKRAEWHAHKEAASQARSHAEAAAEKAKTTGKAKDAKAAQVAANKATRLTARAQKTLAQGESAFARQESASARHSKVDAVHEKAHKAHVAAGSPTEGGAKPAKTAKPAAAQEPAPAAQVTAKPQAKSLSDADLEAHRQEFAKNITTSERMAALMYSSSAYVDINGKLRGSRRPEHERVVSEEQIDKTVKHLDAGLAKNRLTEPVITYRGAEGRPEFSAMKPGDTVVDAAYVSTTTQRHVAKGFADEAENGVIFHITSPAGTKAGAIPSQFEGEKELLLGRGSAMRLDRREVRMEGGVKVHIMHMTVVGQA